MTVDFLTEYKKLQLKTPRFSSVIINSVNSDYCYNVKNLKNCYLLANAVENEDCMYGRDFYDCADCVDCDHVKKCTLCFSCLNCANCYDCDFLQDCESCTDSRYGYNLKSCSDCVGCVGIRQKKYHIFNKAYSEPDYHEKLAGLSEEEIRERFEGLKRSVPRRNLLQTNCENVSGNNLFHCKNVIDSFDMRECEDVGYALEGKNIQDSYDCTIFEDSALCYQISAAHNIQNCNFCHFCVDSCDLEFCECMIACQNCFGCISLHRKQYCILNEQYSPDEYFQKVEEFKNQLREQGLYGQMLIPPVFPREDTVAVWEKM